MLENLKAELDRLRLVDKKRSVEAGVDKRDEWVREAGKLDPHERPIQVVY